MSGGSKTTTTTSGSSAPWAPAQPYLQGGMTEADQLFRNGVGAQTYNSSMVVPFANQTLAGMNQMQALGTDSAGLAQKPLTQFASMMDTILPQARGDFSNAPQFNANLQAQQDRAADSVNQAMSLSGRYGSARHTDQLARTLSETGNQAMLDQQRWASGELGNYGNSMQNAWQAATMPAQSLMAVGSNYEQLAANQLQDQRRLFDEAQAAPWDALARYNAIVQGAGQMGGTQSSTASTPNKLGQQVLGTGLSWLGNALLPGGLF